MTGLRDEIFTGRLRVKPVENHCLLIQQEVLVPVFDDDGKLGSERQWREIPQVEADAPDTERDF